MNSDERDDQGIVTMRLVPETEAAREWAGALERLLDERAEIAAILKTFYEADLSMSSVQPILELAERLNPGLRPRPEAA